MSKLSSEDFGLKMYSRFPPKYREDDVDQRYALKRYLEAAGDGGFKYTIEEWNGIMDIVDPDKVRFDILKVLFEQYGLEVFNGIPEHYLRFLLPLLGEAWSKKGALSVVEFMTAAMSGIKTSTDVTYDEYDNPFVTVKLEMDYNIGDYFPDTEQFKRLVENFLPFYVDFLILYSYVFEEEADLKVDEEVLTVVQDYKNVFEHGFIPYDKGERIYPMLNTDKVLNEDFVLNDTMYTNYEPDWYTDIISYLFSEVGRFFSEFAEGCYYPTLNTDRVLNETFILNDSRPVDDYSDEVKYAAVNEIGVLDTDDNSVIRAVVTYTETQGITSYHVMTNTDKQLNVDFELNSDSETHEDILQYRQSDTGVINSAEVTSYFKQVLNGGAVLNETFILNEPEETDYFEQEISLVPYSENGSVSSSESQISGLSVLAEECSTLTGRSLKSVTNEAELNDDFILNDSIETHYDNIGVSSSEEGGFELLPDTSELNEGELNSTFYLNVGYDDWDYIRTVGALNTSFVLGMQWENSRVLSAYTLA